jgi:hypothetical protein
MNILGWVSNKPNRRFSSTTGAELIALRISVAYGMDVRNTLRFLGVLKEHQKLHLVTDARNVLENIKSLRKPQEANLRLDYNILKELIDRDLIEVRHIHGYANLADILTKNIEKSTLEYWEKFLYNKIRESPVHPRQILESESVGTALLCLMREKANIPHEE